MAEVNVFETVKLLERDHDVPWERYHGEVRKRFASQDMEWLRDFAIVLLARVGASDFSKRIHEALRALALLPGKHAFEFLMLLGNEEPVWTSSRSRSHANGRARVLGAVLGQAQPLEAFASPIGADFPEPTQDLLACWLQEAVLRGKPVADHANLLAVWERLKASGHELATATPELELVLGELEQGQPELTTSYSLLGASSWGGYIRPLDEPVSGGMSNRVFRDVTKPDMVGRLAAFSASARAVSNGEAEVRALLAEQPVAATEVDAAFIRSLPLSCITTVSHPDGRPLVSPPTSAKDRAATSIAVEPISTRALFELLMMSASNGGDYNTAWSGAYGRLAARRTFSALVGAAEHDPWERVEQLARECAAWSFTTNSPWFYEISADLGVLVLQPDKQTLTVAACTDTD